MERGYWLKCNNPSCDKPAFVNKIGSYCSNECRKPFVYETLKPYAGKWYRTKKYRKQKSAQHKRLWKGEMGEKIREKLIPLMSSLEVREKVAFSRKRTAKKLQAIGFYDSPKGLYGGNHLIPYRNEFEKEAFKRIDENPTVIRWTYSELSVPYNNNGEMRKSFLFPDMVIEYSDGRRKVLDLKPDGFAPESISEFQAMITWCSEKNLMYEVWTKESFV